MLILLGFLISRRSIVLSTEVDGNEEIMVIDFS